MLELAGGVGFSMNIGGLLKLKGSLHGHGKVEVPANVEGAFPAAQVGGHLLDLLLSVQDLFNFGRQGKKRLSELLQRLAVQKAPLLSQVEG